MVYDAYMQVAQVKSRDRDRFAEAERRLLRNVLGMSENDLLNTFIEGIQAPFFHAYSESVSPFFQHYFSTLKKEDRYIGNRFTVCTYKLDARKCFIKETREPASSLILTLDSDQSRLRDQVLVTMSEFRVIHCEWERVVREYNSLSQLLHASYQEYYERVNLIGPSRAEGDPTLITLKNRITNVPVRREQLQKETLDLSKKRGSIRGKLTRFEREAKMLGIYSLILPLIDVPKFTLPSCH